VELKATYKTLPEYRLILQCCKGLATVDDVIRMMQKLLADKLYNPAYNIIVDFRTFESFISNSKVSSIYGFIDYLKEKGVEGKVAFLTTQPHQVIVAEIVKKLSANALPIHFETFSTLEACLAFIGCLPNIQEHINKELLAMSR
jgi:hypothetical protein